MNFSRNMKDKYVQKLVRSGGLVVTSYGFESRPGGASKHSADHRPSGRKPSLLLAGVGGCIEMFKSHKVYKNNLNYRIKSEPVTWVSNATVSV